MFILLIVIEQRNETKKYTSSKSAQFFRDSNRIHNDTEPQQKKIVSYRINITWLKLCLSYVQLDVAIAHISYGLSVISLVYALQSYALVDVARPHSTCFHVNYKVIKIDAISCSYPSSKWHKQQKVVLLSAGIEGDFNFWFNFMAISDDQKCHTLIHLCTSYVFPKQTFKIYPIKVTTKELPNSVYSATVFTENTVCDLNHNV